MNIYPAIDIKNNKSVRLFQGVKSKETIYFDNPRDAAEKFKSGGATNLHIVDLDGAFDGESKNFDTIKDIIINNPNLNIQIGGGIRSLEAAKKYLDLGCKVILGSSALSDLELLKTLVDSYGDKIIVSIDCKNGYATTDGWVKSTNVKNVDLIKTLVDVGVKTIVYTDIAKDGAMSGPNFKELELVNSSFDIDLIASGGISSKEDVIKLKSMNIYGAIIGKALYENEILLKDLL
ncbi:MAG: 1-(5-phosphoribosyl)-5-[(5-phosphoribosylamino)methylideneamino]imidazole-4-carboxamide isomerase [Acidaminobacteraceae bacterium]